MQITKILTSLFAAIAGITAENLRGSTAASQLSGNLPASVTTNNPMNLSGLVSSYDSIGASLANDMPPTTPTPSVNSTSPTETYESIKNMLPNITATEVVDSATTIKKLYENGELSLIALTRWIGDSGVALGQKAIGLAILEQICQGECTPTSIISAEDQEKIRSATEAMRAWVIQHNAYEHGSVKGTDGLEIDFATDSLNRIVLTHNAVPYATLLNSQGQTKNAENFIENHLDVIARDFEETVMTLEANGLHYPISKPNLLISPQNMDNMGSKQQNQKAHDFLLRLINKYKDRINIKIKAHKNAWEYEPELTPYIIKFHEEGTTNPQDYADLTAQAIERTQDNHSRNAVDSWLTSPKNRNIHAASVYPETDEKKLLENAVIPASHQIITEPVPTQAVINILESFAVAVVKKDGPEFTPENIVAAQIAMNTMQQAIGRIAKSNIGSGPFSSESLSAWNDVESFREGIDSLMSLVNGTNPQALQSTPKINMRGDEVLWSNPAEIIASLLIVQCLASYFDKLQKTQMSCSSANSDQSSAAFMYSIICQILNLTKKISGLGLSLLFLTPTAKTYANAFFASSTSLEVSMEIMGVAAIALSHMAEHPAFKYLETEAFPDEEQRRVAEIVICAAMKSVIAIASLAATPKNNIPQAGINLASILASIALWAIKGYHQKTIDAYFSSTKKTLGKAFCCTKEPQAVVEANVGNNQVPSTAPTVAENVNSNTGRISPSIELTFLGNSSSAPNRDNTDLTISNDNTASL